MKLVLQIASFKINIVPKRHIPKHSAEYFQDIASRFGSTDTESPVDFSLTVSGLDAVEMPKNTVGLRYGIVSAESEGRLFLENEHCRNCLDPGKKELRVAFKSPEHEKADRIFMSQLRYLVSYLTIESGGIPLHCTAAARNGKAAVLYGPSQSGKSTIAGILKPDWRIFNDEYNVVLPENGVYRVYATPFTNPETLKSCENGDSVVNNLYYIVKSRGRVVAEQMRFRDKYLSVLQSMYITATSQLQAELLMNNALALCTQCRIERLYFAKSPRVSDYLINHNT
ncbi:MAG: hypothetical protein GF350_10590 [Chitinivibrionales bacterium]|nr:hypothetical protein [Chitinivibrionales bacterium]